MASLKIYLTNLGKYNEGELVGEWVELPVDEDELEEVFKRIGISDEPDADGRIYEEYFITDYESDIDGLTVDEYESLDRLNEIAEAIENLDDWDLQIFKNAVEAGYEDADDIENFDPDRYRLYEGVYDDESLGEYIIDELYGGVDGLSEEELERHFDYEAYGRDCTFDWDVSTWLDGWDEEEIKERFGVDDVDDVTIYDYCNTYEGNDRAVGEYMIDEIYGGYMSELGQETLGRYFDYADYASDISRFCGEYTSDGFLEDTEA